MRGHEHDVLEEFAKTGVWMGTCRPGGTAYLEFGELTLLKDVEARTEHILEEIGLSNKRDWAAGLLSYADQPALELGITIAGGADLVLIDEPTSGMSHSEIDAAVALIRRISEGKTLLVVEHDMGVVFDLADRISVLVYGEIIATGTPDEIRANAEVQAAYLGTEAS